MASEILKPYHELKEKIEAGLSNLNDTDIKNLYDTCQILVGYYNSMQMTVKLEANSVYGALGSQFFRFYNPDVAGDITTEGKMLMFEVDKIINHYFTVWGADTQLDEILREKFGDGRLTLRGITKDICIYGDTDSRYVDYGHVFETIGFVPKSNVEVSEFILLIHEKRIRHIIDERIAKYIAARNGENRLIMELEVIGGKGYYLAKKKYVMSLLWKDGKYIAKDGKLKAVGVELIQGSTSNFIKDGMKFILNRLLSPNSSTLQAFQLGAKLVQLAKQQQITDIAKISGLNKYDEYVVSDQEVLEFKTGKGVSVSATIRGAATYNHLLYVNKLTERYPRITPGNRIHWYYTTDPRYRTFAWPVGEELPPFAPPMDYHIQIEKLILNPLRRFIDSDEFHSGGFGASIIQPTLKMLKS